MAKARLLYVMDPVCSWYWGFAPVAEALSRQTTADGAAFHLVADGLRAGHSAALGPNTRGYVLGHWQAVQQTTGQPFRFDSALPEGLAYDTEPACRALVAACSPNEENAWPLARAIQRAFYAEGRDVTQATMLVDLAETVGIPRIEFTVVFDSGEAHDATAAGFAWVQDLGITKFPTLPAGRNGQLALLTSGYQSLAELSPLLDRWLERGRHE